MIKKIRSWLFENRHTKQTVVKNTFWLGISTIASRAIKAIIIIYAARILGAEKYGVFSYALSLAGLLSLFADLGMSPVLTRELVRDPGTLEKKLSAAFVVKLILTAFSALLIACAAPFLVTIKGASPLMPLAALLIAFDSLRDFSASITRAWEKMEIEAGINATTGIGIAIFGLAALWFKPTPFVLMIGYVAGSGLGLLVAASLLGKYLKNFWALFEWDLAKKMAGDALPFALMLILNALTVNIDAVMIGWLRGASDVGLYAAAQRPVLLTYLASTLLSGSIFPTIARLAKKDDVKTRSILEKTTTISLLFAIPVFVGGAILSAQMIGFIFGAQYAAAAPTFAALLFTIILVFPAVNILNATFAYDQQKVMLFSLIIGGVGNTVFDYLLIRPFGIFGSSLATILSQSMAYGYAWWRLKQINNFHTLKHLKKGLFATALMGVATYAMLVSGVHVLLNITISAVVYLTALILLKEKTIEEIKSIFHLSAQPEIADPLPEV